MKLTCNATTPKALQGEIVSLLLYRAVQQESLADVAPTVRAKREFKYAAQQIGKIATEIRDMEIIGAWPSGLLREEWSGTPDPKDPDNFWIDDETGERVNAKTGERTVF